MPHSTWSCMRAPGIRCESTLSAVTAAAHVSLPRRPRSHLCPHGRCRTRRSVACTLQCYCTSKCMPASQICDGLSGPSCLPMHACPRHWERRGGMAMSVRSMYGASCVLQHMVRHKSSSLTASSHLVDGSGWRCSQRLACTMPCYHSSLLRDSFSDTSPSLENIGVSACTHDAGTPKALGPG